MREDHPTSLGSSALPWLLLTLTLLAVGLGTTLGYRRLLQLQDTLQGAQGINNQLVERADAETKRAEAAEARRDAAEAQASAALQSRDEAVAQREELRQKLEEAEGALKRLQTARPAPAKRRR